MAKALRGGKYSKQVQEESASAQDQPKTKYNEYGFEVESSNSPELEFTDYYWKKMRELSQYEGDAFHDEDLQRQVKDKMYELGDNASDAAFTLFDRAENGDNITDDEYWTAYHALAEELGIRPRRYAASDASGYPWEERFASTEQAEMWAAERDGDALYIYDRWTRRYRKIGGKNWKKI